MDIMKNIAERKIQEAFDAGLLDDLPGKGQPLDLEDLSGIAAEFRMGYKILKNARVLPQEMQLKKTVALLREKLEGCQDAETCAWLRRRIAEYELHYRILMERFARGSRVRAG